MYARQRPIIPLQFADSPRTTKEIVPGLVDSGALGNRAPAAWARFLGLELSKGTVSPFHAGGRRRMGYEHEVRLQVGNVKWVAPVTFSEDWDESFMLLGLAGFFDRFLVKIDARRQVTTLTPFNVP
jgi:hypothetical protein